MKIDKVHRVSVADIKENDWFYQVNANKVTRKLKFEPSRHRDRIGYMNQLESIGVYVLIKQATAKKVESVNKSFTLKF